MRYDISFLVDLMIPLSGSSPVCEVFVPHALSSLKFHCRFKAGERLLRTVEFQWEDLVCIGTGIWWYYESHFVHIDMITQVIAGCENSHKWLWTLPVLKAGNALLENQKKNSVWGTSVRAPLSTSTNFFFRVCERFSCVLFSYNKNRVQKTTDDQKQ